MISDSNEIVPFVVDFAEPAVQYPVTEFKYSAELQRSEWAADALSSAIVMSNTTLHTSNGDTQGDESN